MSGLVRTFIAVPVEQGVAGRIADFIGSLAEKHTGIKWVDARNLHITLKFLGDMDRGQIPRLTGAVEAGVSAISKFAVTCKGVGAFPSLNRPRVIYVGLTEGSADLLSLFSAVEAETVKAGFAAADKGFRAHITIGRVREGQEVPGLSAAVAEAREMLFGRMSVSAVHVMESKLSAKGPTYGSMGILPLA